jgi:hypothetical protein
VPTITTTLILDEGVPPHASLTIQVDGEPLTTRDDLPPAEAMKILAALEPIAPAIRDPARAIVAGLTHEVDRGRRALTDRERALKAWREALGDTPAAT